MTKQDLLVEILKHKGIGPNGSKTLNQEDIEQTIPLLKDEACQLVTKATLLTALLLLDKSENEISLINQLKHGIKELPKELHFFLTNKPSSYREQIILKLIERHNLEHTDASEAIKSFLTVDCPPYLTASFLEAERLKRETDIENIAFYNYFLSESIKINLDDKPIIEIGDSFDGVVRNNNYNLFLGPLLGAMGYFVTLTGNKTVAPKFGNTHHNILAFSGKKALLSLSEIEEQIQHYGWCYIDQAVFHKNMWSKATMRKNMVKRPFLATFEKISSPVVSKKGNYIVTSYTHAHYKNANIEILKSNPFCKKAINIKGLEGTIQPKSNISTIALLLNEDKSIDEIKHRFEGSIDNTIEISVEETLNQGLSFLKNNTDNNAKKYLINTSIIILNQFGLMSNKQQVINKIEKVINSGKALDYWNKSHR